MFDPLMSIQRMGCSKGTSDKKIIRRPRLQQGERVRGGITSSKGQEVITSSKGKKQENKKEEARSNYRQQAARSKKQEARKQHAAGRQVRELVLLPIQKAPLGKRLEDRFWIQKATLGSGGRGPQARRPSLRALLFGCGAGAVLGQTASFLVGSESNVRQWGLWPAGPVRPSGPCCLAVAQAPFWVRQLVFL